LKYQSILQQQQRQQQRQWLTAIAVLLRNFSYTAHNLRLLAYSPRVLHVIAALLYTRCHDEATTATLHTLLHLVRYLDVTGQQLLADLLFYSNSNNPEAPPVPHSSHNFGQTLNGPWGGLGACWLAKRLDRSEDTVEGLSTATVLQLTGPYLKAVWSIFPALHAVTVDPRASRTVVLLALDVLQEYTAQARVGLVGAVPPEPKHIVPGVDDYEIPTLRAVLVHAPDALLERLVDLLYLPRLGNDSLEYVDPVYHMVTRVNTLRLLLGYDATVDTDARDRALDVLVPLLELDSPRLAGRLGRKSDDDNSLRTRLFDAVVPILTTTAGRTEASAGAAQLLRELARAETNQAGLDYVQTRLVELASRDPRVSQLVWKELYPVEVDEEEELDEEEEEDNDNGENQGGEEEQDDTE